MLHRNFSLFVFIFGLIPFGNGQGIEAQGETNIEARIDPSIITGTTSDPCLRKPCGKCQECISYCPIGVGICVRYKCNPIPGCEVGIGRCRIFCPVCHHCEMRDDKPICVWTPGCIRFTRPPIFAIETIPPLATIPGIIPDPGEEINLAGNQNLQIQNGKK